MRYLAVVALVLAGCGTLLTVDNEIAQSQALDAGPATSDAGGATGSVVVGDGGTEAASNSGGPGDASPANCNPFGLVGRTSATGLAIQDVVSSGVVAFGYPYEVPDAAARETARCVWVNVDDYVDAPSGSAIRVGVYAGAGLEPGTLLAEATLSWGGTKGWVYGPLVPPIILDREAYWIAVTPISGTLKVPTRMDCDLAGLASRAKNTGAMTDPFGAAGTGTNCDAALYLSP